MAERIPKGPHEAASYRGAIRGKAYVPQLRSIRESRFLTQKALASLAGISQRSITKIEQTQTPARFSTIQKLAEALGVEPWQLVTKDVEPDEEGAIQ